MAESNTNSKSLGTIAAGVCLLGGMAGIFAARVDAVEKTFSAATTALEKQGAAAIQAVRDACGVGNAAHEKRIDKLDDSLQREMRLVADQVNERLLALRAELNDQIAANRDMRGEQIGEVKRRLEAIERPTNTVRDEQLDELRRRLEFLEKKQP